MNENFYGAAGGSPAGSFAQGTSSFACGQTDGPFCATLGYNVISDGIILRDAHPGTAVNTLRSINPSLQRDDKPDQIIASLDPFSPKNGFNPSGSSNYSHEFRERFFKAQATRMNRLVDQALGKLRSIEAGKYYYNDDDPFVIHQSEGRVSRKWTGQFIPGCGNHTSRGKTMARSGRRS